MHKQTTLRLKGLRRRITQCFLYCIVLFWFISFHRSVVVPSVDTVLPYWVISRWGGNFLVVAVAVVS